MSKKATKEILRQKIMTTVKANGLVVTGDFWFMLVFRSKSELKEIAHDLHISI